MDNRISTSRLVQIQVRQRTMSRHSGNPLEALPESDFLRAAEDAREWCDFLLHGSGPALVAANDVTAFVRHFGKPFGVYGITHGSFHSGNDRDLLNQAKFVFFRNSVSLQLAQAEGVKSPVMEFGADSAFVCDLRDDARRP